MESKLRILTYRRLFYSVLLNVLMFQLAACRPAENTNKKQKEVVFGEDSLRAEATGKGAIGEPSTEAEFEAQANLEDTTYGWYTDIRRPGELRRIKELGVNTVIPYVSAYEDNVQSYLDTAEKAGLKVWLQIPDRFVRAKNNRDAVNTVNTQGIQSWIEKWKQHAAVTSWYLFDEPNNSSLAKADRIRYAYDFIKTLDNRPVSVVFNSVFDGEQGKRLPGNPVDPRYYQALDYLMLDFYPIHAVDEHLKSPELRLYDSYVKTGRSIANENGKKFYKVVQGYGRNESGAPQFDRRNPSVEEFAYMVNTNFLHKVDGLFFWSYPRTTENWLDSVFSPVMERAYRTAETLKDSQTSQTLRIAATNNNALRFREVYNPINRRYYYLLVNASIYATKATLLTTVPNNYLSFIDLGSSASSPTLGEQVLLEKTSKLNERNFSVDMQPYEVRFLQSVFK